MSNVKDKMSNAKYQMWDIKCQMSIRLNFCRSVPPEFLRSFLKFFLCGSFLKIFFSCHISLMENIRGRFKCNHTLWSVKLTISKERWNIIFTFLLLRIWPSQVHFEKCSFSLVQFEPLRMQHYSLLGEIDHSPRGTSVTKIICWRATNDPTCQVREIPPPHWRQGHKPHPILFRICW